MTQDSATLIYAQTQLQRVAMTALEVGRMLMESGAKSDVIKQGLHKVARGLGAETVHTRIGFASLAITLTREGTTTTCMLGTGAHGVNMQVNHALRELCGRVERGGMAPDEVRAELEQIKRIPRHPKWLNALAAGIACASFGRLLGVDWVAFVPILIGSTLGQWVRLLLHERGVNTYVITAIVSFIASAIAGLASIQLGSQMVPTAMSAGVLMLVPGVPSMNAQMDIMEGSPTLGSARFVSVAMVIVFLTVGVGAASMLMGSGHEDMLSLHNSVLHQAVFGAIAAAGFGVLFNFSPITLLWCAAGGGLALAVRTIGLDLGWTLEAASFVAAATVAIAVELLDMLPVQVRRAGNALALAGCIPMVPGSAAAHWIIGLLRLTEKTAADQMPLLLSSSSAGLRVIFTVGAIGAGLTIVTSLFRRPDFPRVTSHQADSSKS